VYVSFESSREIVGRTTWAQSTNVTDRQRDGRTNGHINDD